MLLAWLVAVSLTQADDLSPPPPPPSGPVEDAPLPPPPLPPAPAPLQPPAAPRAAPRLPASERETTIRALRGEIDELDEQKGNIGFAFPSIFLAGGAGLAIFGLVGGFNESLNWLKTTLIIGGTGIAVLSTFWLVYRIVKAISLGNQLDLKREQLERLEAQRLQVSFGLSPGGGFATVGWAF